MKTITKILLVLFAIIGLITVGLFAYAYFRDEQPAQEQVHQVSDVPEFIKTTYGPYDGRNKGYPRSMEEADNPEHYVEPCLNEIVTVKGVKHRMLALCSKPFAGADDSHDTRGVVDFFVLRVEPQGLTLVASSYGFESGNRGVPGSVKTMKLGRDFYGFLVEETNTAQGVTSSSKSILVASGDAVTLAAALPGGLDNSGSVQDKCESQEQSCPPRIQTQFALSVDDSNPNATTYPLKIAAKGTHDGAPKQGEWRIPFDAKLWRYEVPADLSKF